MLEVEPFSWQWVYWTYQVAQVVDALLVGVLRPVVVGIRQVPRVLCGAVQPGSSPRQVVAVAGAVVPIHHAAVECLHSTCGCKNPQSTVICRPCVAVPEASNRS